MEFRERFRVPADGPLRPFDIEPHLQNVRILRKQDLVEYVSSRDSLTQAFGASNQNWSAITILLDDSRFVIILNDSHATTRQCATLMEEFFHIILRHKPTAISECPLTGHMARHYQKEQEQEAYWSAAAALVPYAVLKEMVDSGASPASIATYFEVSAALVSFRLKVTRLWRQRAMGS